MKTVKILDREFKVSIPAEKIDNAIAEMAEKMNKDLAGKIQCSFVFLMDHSCLHLT